MQDPAAGDGGEEDDGPAGAGGDHVARAGLGHEEGAREVDVEEGAEHGGVVRFGFDVGALWCTPVSVGSGGDGVRLETLGGFGGAYSTTPAELITTSTAPRSAAIRATAPATAVSSRTSTL